MNNRELKFRAWSTKHKKFLTIGFHIIGETTLFDLLNQHRLEELDTIEITQFTGLKDNKGVEIYEGDIISYTPFNQQDYKNTIVEVLTLDAFHWFQDLEEMLNESNKCDVEVIGNIFENKDLLKK